MLNPDLIRPHAARRGSSGRKHILKQLYIQTNDFLIAKQYYGDGLERWLSD